jgi:hypothetical protein
LEALKRIATRVLFFAFLKRKRPKYISKATQIKLTTLNGADNIQKVLIKMYNKKLNIMSREKQSYINHVMNENFMLKFKHFRKEKLIKKYHQVQKLGPKRAIGLMLLDS